jgi:taurine dioxygenase
MAASPEDLRFEPVTPAVGATVTGVDLNADLTDAAIDRLYAALVAHGVLVFPDQALAPDRHQAFAERFGALDKPHPIYPHAPGAPHVTLLENDAARPPDTAEWHTDLTFYADPPFASILCAVSVPPVGGDTLWMSLAAAYDTLPAGMKSDLEGLRAHHDMGSFRNGFVADDGTHTLSDAMQRMGHALHPVVRVHPVSGRRLLYVNSGFTQEIVGLPKYESDRLLAYLFDHMNRPEFQMRLRWRAGTVVMWDNRATMHYACADYLPAYRRMHRVTVIDDRRAARRTDAAAE